MKYRKLGGGRKKLMLNKAREKGMRVLGREKERGKD